MNRRFPPIDAVTHDPGSASNPSGRAPGSVVTVGLTVAGQRFTLFNVVRAHTISPGVSYFVFLPAVADFDRPFPALADGG